MRVAVIDNRWGAPVLREETLRNIGTRICSAKRDKLLMILGRIVLEHINKGEQSVQDESRPHSEFFGKPVPILEPNLTLVCVASDRES